MEEHKTLDFPLRHLSIRVPWHDSGWVGSVCRAPKLNGACVKLKGIAAADKDREQPFAGQSLEELPAVQWPCCVDERSAFMAPFELELVKRKLPELMANVAKLNVPLLAEVGVGANWEEAH